MRRIELDDRRTVIGSLVLAVLASVGFACSSAAAQERAPGVQRLQMVVEVDVERARRVGWTGSDDASVVLLASRLVERRFDALQRAARVELEPGTKRFRVSLPSLDSRDRERFEGMLRSMGVCEFFFAAEGDLQSERERWKSWRSAHPDASPDEFNQRTPAEQGPGLGFAWFATRFGEGGVLGEPILVRLTAEAPDHFDASSFERFYSAQDQYGYPAVGFTLRKSRRDDFARVTEAHVSQRLCIVLDNKVRSAPSLNSKLVDGGIIEGRFSDEEAKRLADDLTKVEGPLRIVEAR